MSSKCQTSVSLRISVHFLFPKTFPNRNKDVKKTCINLNKYISSQVLQIWWMYVHRRRNVLRTIWRSSPIAGERVSGIISPHRFSSYESISMMTLRNGNWENNRIRNSNDKWGGDMLASVPPEYDNTSTTWLTRTSQCLLLIQLQKTLFFSAQWKLMAVETAE